MQRMSADNGEDTAAAIRCEPSDGLIRNLLRALIAGQHRQSIVPRRYKYRRFGHESPFSPSRREFSELNKKLRALLEWAVVILPIRAPDR